MKPQRARSFVAAVVVLTAAALTGCSDTKGAASNASAVSSAVSQSDSWPSVDPSVLASESHITLEKTVTTEQFTLSVPQGWSVSQEGDDSSSTAQYVLFDKKSDKVYGGGVMKQEWKAQKGEKKIELPALLQWTLPNHTSISETERLPGFSMDAYLLKVEQEVPAADSQWNGTHWTYIVFVDSENSDASKFTAYELLFNADFASEADTVKVAQSFKLT